MADRWGVALAVSAVTPLMSEIDEATASADAADLFELVSAGVRLIETLPTGASRTAGLTLADIPLPTGTIVATVVRGGQPPVPNGSFRIEEGEEVRAVSESAPRTISGRVLAVTARPGSARARSSTTE